MFWFKHLSKSSVWKITPEKRSNLFVQICKIVKNINNFEVTKDSTVNLRTL